MMRVGVSVLTVALGVLGGAVAAQQDGDAAHETEDRLTIDTAPAQAQLNLVCRFAVECYEDEVCAETSFGAALTGDAGGMDAMSMVVQAELKSDAATVELLGVRDAGAISLSGGPFEARHLLSVAADGAARYSVHYLEGPVVVSYLGRCEGE